MLKLNLPASSHSIPALQVMLGITATRLDGELTACGMCCVLTVFHVATFPVCISDVAVLGSTHLVVCPIVRDTSPPHNQALLTGVEMDNSHFFHFTSVSSCRHPNCSCNMNVTPALGQPGKLLSVR